MSSTIIVPEQRRQMTAPAQADSSILAVISRAATDPACDIDKLERLMAMHERMQARDAEAEFNAAMAAMQSDIPSIAERGAIVVNGQKRSDYATFEDINDVIKPIMQAHGFAITFKVENMPGGLSVTGILMHRAGHRESTTMLLPLDTSGSKNAVQAVGSSTSYGKRYVMSALLNLTTRGEDDDGHAAVPTANVTSVQAAGINALLDRCTQKTRDWFTGEYGTAECVPKGRHDLLVAQLNKAIRAAEAANADNQ
ncbi:single-stranded DNA-binding protein [Pseudomonas plecoglossicida]|uniref:Single-stranded DNA-binding protein n=1 Tax=Pseudomonas plecoglossicida TaxID=70775 RepID=A0ABX4U190_PSEDL|nr:ERF family protein [Pseudomonas plecoglossicida]PLU86294.1 single-stranded DNA-binding protein [Pseudomonas plecoglossicida]PLU94047.1 single-stranded DNA-binding protein [Pseudomonas plecoglossicida]PLV04888.1 single-stranded DNA-binding protein [Pseudomonas plecoglossicida]PLV14291.1 single-stranded DNA-binding protein [Pseudomonas plecoglossicida]